MTSKKKLTKKFILTADLHGKTQDDTLSKETDMVKAQIANPTLVSGLNPTATTVQGQITAITDPNTGLIHQRAVLEAQTQALTLQINKGETAIKDIIVSQWMPQTQTALTGTTNAESNAALLLFGVKGQATGHATTTVASTARTAASAPVIVKIDTGVAGQHTLHIHNNITGKRSHPADVLRVDIYGQTGGTAPTNLAALIANGGGWLGTAKGGKYVNPFVVTAANQGKVEYYIAVYIEKATKKPAAQSNEDSAIIE
jgi:hypothetical protein